MEVKSAPRHRERGWTRNVQGSHLPLGLLTLVTPKPVTPGSRPRVPLSHPEWAFSAPNTLPLQW